MTKSKLIAVLVSFVAWVLPVYATAQNPGRGEFLQLRADDPRCGEGFACFQVGAYRPGADLSFERMLTVVNRRQSESSSVTIGQLENANQCGVLYVRDRSSIQGANGVCESRNGTRERMTFESFCRGSLRCARWPLANRVYRVPSVRILTPDERAEEMAREISNAVVTATVPAPATLGANLRELIELRRSVQPPTDENEVAALTAMADALQRASGVDSVAPSTMAEREPVSAPDRSTELAALRAQLERVTAERDEAQSALASATDGRWPWWVTLFLTVFGLTIAFAIGRWTASPIATVPVTEEEPRPNTRHELEDTQERLRTSEHAVDTLRAKVAAIEDVFMDLMETNERPVDFNKVIAFLKSAGAFMADWVVPLMGETPETLCEKLARVDGNVVGQGESAIFRKMRDEWSATPHFTLPFTVESLAQTIGAWLRLDGLAKAWSGFEPAFVLEDGASDGGLKAYVDNRVEARERTLELMETRVGEPLKSLLGDFDAIVVEIPGGEIVDTDCVKRELGFKRRAKPPTSLIVFLERVFEGLKTARRELDMLLDWRESDEPAPIPGRIPIPPVPSEAVAIAEEVTRVMRDPLFENEETESPVVDSAAERDDEVTQILQLEGNNGRPRRNTNRGFPMAPSKPPEGE